MTGSITQRRRVGADGEWVIDPVYLIDGAEVAADVYFTHFPQSDTFAGCVYTHHGAGWPLASDALAVHPEQVKEAQDASEKKGVPTTFDRDGRPVFTDRAHRKKYMDAYGFHARNSYGSD